jgi:hypothetical protein
VKGEPGANRARPDSDTQPKGTASRRRFYWSAILNRGDLSAEAQRAYIGLACYADGMGLCHPTVQQLASRIAITRRSAQRLLRDLEAARVIRAVQPARRGRATTYQLLVCDDLTVPKRATDAPPQTDGFGATAASPNGAEWGDSHGPLGRQPWSERGGVPRLGNTPVNTPRTLPSYDGATAVAARVTRPRRARRPAADNLTGHRELVGRYRERCAEVTAGAPVLEADVGRVAGAVRRLLVAGKPAQTIEAAVDRAALRNQPGLVERFVGDLEREAAGNGAAMHRPRRRTAGDQLPELIREIEQSERART